MLSSTSVHLYPDSSEVILYGGPREARSALVTGRVVVSTRNIDQVKSLLVTLRPQRQRLFQSQHPLTPPLLLHARLVVDGQTEPHVINSSVSEKEHEWRFTIGVPGATAETVFCSDHYVAYELVAEARTQAAFTGAVQSKACSIAIKRAPNTGSPWTILASEPVSESAVWRSKLEVTLVAGSRIIHDSQSMPVRGVIRPLEKGISLVRAGFQIIEKISRKVVLFGSNQTIGQSDIVVDNSIDMPNAGHDRSNTGDSSSSGTLRTLDGNNSLLEATGLPLIQETSASRCLHIPKIYTEIQYDIHRGPIRVNHELIFFVTVIDKLNTLHNLRLATPVFVLPRLNGRQINLPRYEDTDMDQLVESSSEGKLERDADFWSNYVFIDTFDQAENQQDESSASQLQSDNEVAYIEPISACPLALEGYQQLSPSDVPPPSYPGAKTTVERTFVSTGLAVPDQASISTRRARVNNARSISQTPLPEPMFAAETSAALANSDFVVV
ncbi:hypothetical protein GGI05_004386 [Coemansia sp. RSA 2603]|nr:hypothetical protein GGI05_004386 [Coemansia sp. RSA 2603]